MLVTNKLFRVIFSISFFLGNHLVFSQNFFCNTPILSDRKTNSVSDDDPESVEWVGETSGENNWFVASNWNPAFVPTCETNVHITNTGNHPDIGFNSSSAACRNINLVAGTILSFSDNKAELNVCGSFSQSGIIATNGKGKIIFQGSQSQTFTKTNTASGNLHNVELSNTASPPTLTINDGNISGATYQDLVVDSNFIFINGIVITEGGRKLVIENSESNSVSGNSVSGYVFGRISRKVANGNKYDFPVGGNPFSAISPNYPYELMNINFTSVTGLKYLTVKFENPSSDLINNIASNTASPTLPVNSESEGSYSSLIDCGGTNTSVGVSGNGGVWTVIPDAGTATYQMTLYGRNFDNVNSDASFSILKRNLFSICSTSPDWTLDGNYSSSSHSEDVVISSRTNMSDFSQFSLGSTPIITPVELVSFDATCVNHGTVLSWITATEMNNNYFTIEKSCDEKSFSYQTIATIHGAGNSSTIKQYSYIDNNSDGNCYYRLSQTDFNGTTKLFSPVSINCRENSNFNFVNTLPNPVENELNVIFTDTQNENIQLTITDILGQQIISKNILSESGLNNIFLDVSDFNAGVYIVKLNSDKQSFVKKIVKK